MGKETNSEISPGEQITKEAFEALTPERYREIMQEIGIEVEE